MTQSIKSGQDRVGLALERSVATPITDLLLEIKGSRFMHYDYVYEIKCFMFIF